MKITVFGAGYVGLVTAAGLAEKGHHVVCADTDADRIDSLQSGKVPFHERGLQELVVANAARGRLAFALAEAAEPGEGEIVMLAVGTPQLPDGSTDLSALNSAAASLSPRLVAGQVVVVKSTVPVGTGDRLEGVFQAGVHVASNPEFLREGSAVADFLHPERIVVGVRDGHAGEVLTRLYANFDAPLFTLRRREAELAKYAANAFLALKITFANEMGDLAASLGASFAAVREVMEADSRIGKGFLVPGPGYGGSCFPKDVSSLLAQARAADVDLPLTEATRRSNDARVERIAAAVAAEGDRDGLTVILGGAFKAGTGDIRESRGIAVAAHLSAGGHRVRFHDPMAAPSIRRAGYDATDDLHAALEGAHRIVVMTEWPEYEAVNWSECAERVSVPVVMDYRGVIDAKEATRAGFAVRGLDPRP